MYLVRKGRIANMDPGRNRTARLLTGGRGGDSEFSEPDSHLYLFTKEDSSVFEKEHLKMCFTTYFESASAKPD